MILIPTRVGPSAIHGLGLFTTRAVKAGEPIWRFVPGFDQRFLPETVEALPSPAREHVLWFAYVDMADGCRVLSGDLTCFMNHSDKPNTGIPSMMDDTTTTYALRDLAEGEEITCDYLAFDADAERKLRPSHQPSGPS